MIRNEGRAGLTPGLSPENAAEEVATFAVAKLGAPDARRLAAQRARLVQEEPRPSFSVRGWRGGGVVVAAAAAGLVFVVDPAPKAPNDEAVSARVTADESAPAGLTELTATWDGRQLEADAWVNAEQAPSIVAFSDQSEVELASGSRARLTSLDSEAVRFTVESGELTASVTPGGQRRWIFKAGPYAVTVLGTVLKLSWEPGSEALSVQVRRGRVKVSGGQLDGQERTVAAGESFSVAPPSELETQVESEQAAVKKVGEKSSKAAPQAPSGQARPSVEVPAKSAPSSTGRWKLLAEQGEYENSLAAAEAQGFAALTGSVGPEDMLLLADTARLAGAAGKARVVLKALRERHPRHRNSAVAAFTLGRMAYQRDDRSAVRWFRVYLRSSPSGSLAEAARGRLMLSLSRLGDRQAAIQAAKGYLARHPRGSHASTARSMLSKR